MWIQVTNKNGVTVPVNLDNILAIEPVDEASYKLVRVSGGDTGYRLTQRQYHKVCKLLNSNNSRSFKLFEGDES